eukprot:scaffold1881_cov256-Pinguiococcus_pyrenoidosus.AAC.14
MGPSVVDASWRSLLGLAAARSDSRATRGGNPYPTRTYEHGRSFRTCGSVTKRSRGGIQSSGVHLVRGRDSHTAMLARFLKAFRKIDKKNLGKVTINQFYNGMLEKRSIFGDSLFELLSEYCRTWRAAVSMRSTHTHHQASSTRG